MKQPPDSVLNSFEQFFWGWEMKQPLIPFWTILGMRIEATPESARTIIRPVVAAARIPDAGAVRIPMFLRNFLICAWNRWIALWSLIFTSKDQKRNSANNVQKMSNWIQIKFMFFRGNIWSLNQCKFEF
jgi:hypothetical protein